jgi:hypothetical protein
MQRDDYVDRHWLVTHSPHRQSRACFPNHGPCKFLWPRRRNNGRRVLGIAHPNPSRHEPVQVALTHALDQVLAFVHHLIMFNCPNTCLELIIPSLPLGVCLPPCCCTSALAVRFVPSYPCRGHRLGRPTGPHHRVARRAVVPIVTAVVAAAAMNAANWRARSRLAVAHVRPQRRPIAISGISRV